MPSRPVSLVILALWLAALGWLFVREVRPKLGADEPPPFTIDLADEVRAQPTLSWIASLNGQDAYHVKTRIEYVEPTDTYELHADYAPWAFRRMGANASPLPFKSFNSTFHIGRRGDRDWELRKLTVDATLVLDQREEPITANVRLEGLVSNGQFRARLEAKTSDGRELEWNLDPVPTSGRGSVYLPLHPVGKITGLQPGQKWTVPLVDADALARALGQSGAERVLQARVLDEPAMLHWENKDHLCLVIDYQGEDFRGKTWVRQEDGLVLRQEAVLGENHWELNREKQVGASKGTGFPPK
jgi:hypothetical protein